MKNYRLFCCMICMMMVATTVRGQSASHWSCDIHAYQYDMTVYLQLKSGSKILADYSDYEIAAFCGEECRGVATLLTVTAPDESLVYILRLRVRSNNVQGDEIQLKVYQKSTETEELLGDSFSFESMSVQGSPSEPVIEKLDDILPGDANGDGKVNVTDVGMVIDHILEHTPTGFIESAADVNGDGKVNVTDVGLIIDIILSDKASVKKRGTVNKVDVFGPQ